MPEESTFPGHSSSNRAQHTAGQAMVEFVFALPILLLLIAGIIEFGRLMAVHSVINAASREAARFAASAGDAGPGTQRHYQDCDAIRESAIRVSESLLEIDPSNIEIEYDSGPGSALLTPVGCPPPVAQVGLGTRVVVRVSADYEPMVPLVPLGPMSISSETRRTLVTDVDPNP
ncbi:MAG: TadE/TadG family type IV pilus assembly protein [Anaerolineales bacterium]|nr:TadE/TadG family type IV pilus assembly protein [Anaerolineales bacterium]